MWGSILGGSVRIGVSLLPFFYLGFGGGDLRLGEGEGRWGEGRKE